MIWTSDPVLTFALTGMAVILAWFVWDVVWNVSLNVIADSLPDDVE